MKPRNYLIPLLMKRKSGSHIKSIKQNRSKEKSKFIKQLKSAYRENLDE